jgi:hypothetical protein
MKKVIFFLLLVTSARSYAQHPGLTDNYLLNFTVPDMPAFKAFGKEASDILRPSDIQKTAIMLSPFISDNQGVIPKNFALEFAPWKLASANWTLTDYRGVRSFLYNSSFSIGALRDSGTYNSKLSLGYRFSILSRQADILKASKNRVFKYMDASVVAISNLANYWIGTVLNLAPDQRLGYFQNHEDEFYAWLAAAKEVTDPTFRILYDSLGHALAPGSGEISASVLDQMGAAADSLIAEYKREHWNASRFDFAIAWVGASPDTLIKNAQFSSFHVWATEALAVHRGGQLLIGANFKRPRSIDGEIPSEFTVNLRYYLGTPSFRGFLEGQYKSYNVDAGNNALLLNLGAELRIRNDFWVTASAGIQNYLTEDDPLNKLVSSIDLRYAFNRGE